MNLENPRFLRLHLFYPLLCLICISSAILFFDIDRLLADYFYALEGGSWTWKNSWLMEKVLHKGGRNLSISLAVMILFIMAAHYFRGKAYDNKIKPLLYLFIAIAGSSLLVSLFKASFAVSCPWEFQRYGGHLPYYNVFHQFFLRNGDGCFPAGHASAGYSWISLYFFGLYFRSNLRWAGLAAALVAGLMFGFAQQLRGAHFISHDLWTFATCWFFSLTLYLYMFSKKSKTYHLTSLSLD